MAKIVERCLDMFTIPQYPNKVDRRSLNTALSFSYSPLYFDATGTVIPATPWLKNKNDNPRRILLYSLLIAHSCGNVPSIALVDYITREHHIFSIRQRFYSAAMIQAVIQEMTGYTLQSYLQKT